MSALLSRRHFLSLATAALAAACGRENKPQAVSTAPGLMPTELPLKVPTVLTSPTPARETLRLYADKAQLELGTSIPTLDILPSTEAIIRTDFNSGMIFHQLLWGYFEKERGKFNFQNADTAVRFLASNRLSIVGHSLMFWSSYPEWLKQRTFSKQELAQIVTDHVTGVVSHLKGKVSRWIVVNEAHPHPGNAKWDDVFLRVLGLDYIDLAFRAARQADPSAILIYNDYSNETSRGPNTELSRTIVNRLKAQNLIDGLGLQMHINGKAPPAADDITLTMRSYDLPIYITEADVNMQDVSGSRDERFQKQSAIYDMVTRAALASDVCKSLSFWDIGDRYSWLQNEVAKTQPYYAPNADSTMFDETLKPKPAYYSVLEVLKQAAERR